MPDIDDGSYTRAMTSASESAFSDLSLELRGDPDDDVTAEQDRLLVHGRAFAALDGDALLVDLPAHRATDLVARGMATPASGPTAAVGTWVTVPDTENWGELAAEAHQFVGEPPVGRQS